MSETPRRYSAEELSRALKLCEVQWEPQASIDLDEALVKMDEYHVGCALRIVFEAAKSAAEDASRLEQIQKWVSVQMSEGELRGYLPDLLKLLSSSAGRREDKP